MPLLYLAHLFTVSYTHLDVYKRQAHTHTHTQTHTHTHTMAYRWVDKWVEHAKEDEHNENFL